MSPRQTAIQNGDMFYEGKPCKKGHTTRYASDSKCTLCAKINGKIRYATPEYKKHHTEWKMKRYHNNPVCRMKDLLSRTTRYFAKQVGSSKGGRTHEILGYTAEEYCNDIELKFKEGMTWDNQGMWHVDHVKPMSWFTSIDQMKECFALNNLKPEWGEWNMSKGNRFAGSSEDYPLGITQ